MLTKGQLAKAFQPYWDDMKRCRKAGAYWLLLHVVVCLPDICAALESGNGEATRQRYEDWCNKHLSHQQLSGPERYRMRCKVPHQGRAATDQPGRYASFAFGQPSDTGVVDHMRVEAGTLHMDVGELAREAQGLVESWIRRLEANPQAAEAVNVEKNLPSLVRITQHNIPVAGPSSGGPIIITVIKTN